MDLDRPADREERDDLLDRSGGTPARNRFRDLRLRSARRRAARPNRADRADNVRFAGTLDTTAELHAAYQQADLLVLACVEASNGDTDGLPTVLPEAMAAGVPVVTSRLANIPDLIVDDVHGFLAEPGDVESLTATIRKAATLDPEKKRRLIERASQRVASFASQERMMRTLSDIWRSRPIDIVLVTYDTPAYNDWETTRAIIDRVYEHTAVPFTLFVVDNGSQASFRARVEERYGERPNFRFIKMKQNLFVGPATNIGIQAGFSGIHYLSLQQRGVRPSEWVGSRYCRGNGRTPAGGPGGYLISLPNYRNGREYLGYPGFENWRSQDFARENPERRLRHVQGGILAIRRSAFDTVAGSATLLCTTQPTSNTAITLRVAGTTARHPEPLFGDGEDVARSRNACR